MNIFFWVPQKKDIRTGLDWYEGGRICIFGWIISLTRTTTKKPDLLASKLKCASFCLDFITSPLLPCFICISCFSIQIYTMESLKGHSDRNNYFDTFMFWCERIAFLQENLCYLKNTCVHLQTFVYHSTCVPPRNYAFAHKSTKLCVRSQNVYFLKKHVFL